MFDARSYYGERCRDWSLQRLQGYLLNARAGDLDAPRTTCAEAGVARASGSASGAVAVLGFTLSVPSAAREGDIPTRAGETLPAILGSNHGREPCVRQLPVLHQPQILRDVVLHRDDRHLCGQASPVGYLCEPLRPRPWRFSETARSAAGPQAPMSSNEPLDHQASCLACANCGQA
ncbi:hypothetical protein AK812_SmicGene33468 [Symbiodinium microadriaticum]|uniref:Uncharacterized protein n=1 Tax=Symbiodinium microadriaticum TaxID=2951 RepID=A0A1Q9CRH4_SYMMI|nr:hypothetical protein AK812_SmicGene33468 [Symbiodinium microadriaticum]